MTKISFVSASNVANAIIGFAFLTASAKVLSLEDFGKYSLLTALLLSIARFMDFGTNSIFVTKSIEQSDNTKNITTAFLTLRVFLFLLAIPISLFFLSIFNLLTLPLSLVFLVGLLGYLINFTYYAFFQKEEQFGYVISLNLFPALIKGFFALLILMNIFKPNLETAFFIFAGSALSGLLLTTFLPKYLFKLNPSLKKGFEILKEAYPAGLSQLIYEWWPTINNGIAKFARGFSDVGIFSLANKMSGVFSLISFSIFTVLLPKNALLKKKRSSYDFKETGMISILILAFAFFAIFAGQVFINLFFGEKFKDAVVLLDILIFASAFTAIHSFIENYFFIEKKTKVILAINLSKLALFLSCAYFLTKSFDMIGLAYANLAASIFAVILTFFIISKSEKIIVE